MFPLQAIQQHSARPVRSPSQTATLMLALFVFAAVPTFSIAQGLDAAVLAELLREHARPVPARDHSGAVSSLSRHPRAARMARPRIALPQRTALRVPAPILATSRLPARHHVSESLLSLPPPGC